MNMKLVFEPLKVSATDSSTIYTRWTLTMPGNPKIFLALYNNGASYELVSTPLEYNTYSPPSSHYFASVYEVQNHILREHGVEVSFRDPNESLFLPLSPCQTPPQQEGVDEKTALWYDSRGDSTTTHPPLGALRTKGEAMSSHYPGDLRDLISSIQSIKSDVDDTLENVVSKVSDLSEFQQTLENRVSDVDDLLNTVENLYELVTDLENCDSEYRDILEN